MVRVAYGERSFLFTGDVGGEGERALAAKVPAADVLKVPHHGSRTSSSGAFIKRTAPSVAVASVGWQNRFGLPHAEVVERYEGAGVELLRTDLDGAVSVTTDGDYLRVER